MKILRLPPPFPFEQIEQVPLNAEWEAREPAFPEKIGLQIIKDIEPYQSVVVDVATGNAPRIGSRAEHRAFARRNNLLEVGNEKLKPPKEPTFTPLRPQIVQALHEVKYR
jgi:hypothetical protein